MKQIKSNNLDFHLVKNAHSCDIYFFDTYFAQYFSTIDSTNTLAKKDEYSSGIFLCGYQTNGYGQRNNVWQSSQDKNVLMTYFTTLNQTYDFSAFAYTIGLAISHGLNEKFNIASYVKKPNDIMVGNSKLCGILVETQYYGPSQKIIVGIGLNHLQTSFDTATYSATSLVNLGIDVDYLDIVYMLSEIIKGCIAMYCDTYKRT